MHSPAFVSVSPVVARSSSSSSSSSFVSGVASLTPVSHNRNLVAVPRRARSTVHMSAESEDKSVPQGFTPFSEQLNGRAAMMGFVLAVVTEAITGQGIVGQVGSVVKIFEGVGPFSGFN